MTMAKNKHDENKKPPAEEQPTATPEPEQKNEKVARQRVTTHGYYHNGAVIPAGSNPDDYPGIIPEEFIQEVEQ